MCLSLIQCNPFLGIYVGFFGHVPTLFCSALSSLCSLLLKVPLCLAVRGWFSKVRNHVPLGFSKLNFESQLQHLFCCRGILIIPVLADRLGRASRLYLGRSFQSVYCDVKVMKRDIGKQ